MANEREIDLAALIDETRARIDHATEMANTTRAAEAWNAYISDRRYFMDLLVVLEGVDIP